MKIEPEISANFMEIYKQFISIFGEPERIYYPGCGTDVTPGIFFSKSEVIFLDPLPLSEVIGAAVPGATFVCDKAENYSSTKPFDLVIDMHSHAPFAHEVKDLKVGGHLIISNKTSDHAFDNPQFELAGVYENVSNGDDGSESYQLITTKLAKFLEEEAKPEKIRFSNKRIIKAPYYVFRKE